MPDFTIPPWLEPQRFAPLFAQGAQTGVAAAAQRNEAAQVAAKLAAQSAIEAAQLKLAQEVAMQKAAQSALELELEKQRNSAMLAFRERELDSTMSFRESQLENAARGLAERERYNQAIETLRMNEMLNRSIMNEQRTTTSEDIAKLRALQSQYSKTLEAAFGNANAPEVLQIKHQIDILQGLMGTQTVPDFLQQTPAPTAPPARKFRLIGTR